MQISILSYFGTSLREKYSGSILGGLWCSLKPEIHMFESASYILTLSGGSVGSQL